MLASLVPYLRQRFRDDALIAPYTVSGLACVLIGAVGLARPSSTQSVLSRGGSRGGGVAGSTRYPAIGSVCSSVARWGFSREYVSQVETGKYKDMRVDRVDRLADVLEIPSDWLSEIPSDWLAAAGRYVLQQERLPPQPASKRSTTCGCSRCSSRCRLLTNSPVELTSPSRSALEVAHVGRHL